MPNPDQIYSQPLTEEQQRILSGCSAMSTPTAEEKLLHVVDNTEPLNSIKGEDSTSDFTRGVVNPSQQAQQAQQSEAGKALAQQRLQQLLEAVSRLPSQEQQEFAYCRERLHFLTAKYQSSAKLAIMAHALLTSIE